jgi:hypothetical protein
MVYSSMPSTGKEVPAMFQKIKEMGYTKYPSLLNIRDPQKYAMMSGNKFIMNIIYYTRRQSFLYDIHGSFDLATTMSDYNTIYHAGLPLMIPFMKTSADLQWIKWKENGLDRNSVVTDPLFSNVATGDFTLSSASPALEMGFKPIPFDKIGLYQDPMRASWPLSDSAMKNKAGIAPIVFTE